MCVTMLMTDKYKIVTFTLNFPDLFIYFNIFAV